jgi:hypothetical protein
MSQVNSRQVVSNAQAARRNGRSALNFVLWHYDARRALPVWGAALALLSFLTLLPEGPLTGGDTHWQFAWPGGLAGILIAWRLFADTGHTQAYVFSRGLSRSQLFWNRWLLGMTLLALQAGTVWLVLVSGIRSGWRQLLDGADAPVYPLVAPYETVVIPSLGIASMLAFAVATLLMALRGLQNPSRVASSGGALVWFLFDLPLVLLVTLYGQSVFVSPVALSTGGSFAIGLGAIVPCTLAAWHGFRNWEVLP